MSSIDIEVLITGPGGPAIERVTNAIRDGLRDNVNATEWHLKVRHRTAAHTGEHSSWNGEQVLSANNVR